MLSGSQVQLIGLGFGTAIAVLIGYYTISVILNRKKYKHISGSPTNGIIGFYFGHALDILKDMSEFKVAGERYAADIEKYGSVVKYNFFNLTFIHTVDPHAIREILVTEDFPKYNPVYDAVANPFGQRFVSEGLLTIKDYNHWKQRRNLFNPSFYKHEIMKFTSIFNAKVDILIERLTKFADGKTVLNMSQEFDNVANDLIAQIAFGLDMNTIYDSNNKLNSFLKAVAADINLCLLDPFASIKLNKRDMINNLRRNIKELREFAKNIILERINVVNDEQYSEKDILSMILKHTDKETFDIEAMIDDFLTFFGAGQDTTANTLAFFLLEIGTRPDVHKKLEDEINEVLGERSELTFEDINKLKYTEAVWKEVQRLHPTITQIFRITTKEILIDEHKIPSGTPIILSPYSSGRCAKFFPDPLKFDPDRFFDEKKKEENIINPCTYFPFSTGNRDCIGKNFAMIEGKVVIAKLLQRFNFVLDKTQSFDSIVQTSLKPKNGVRCSIKMKY